MQRRCSADFDLWFLTPFPRRGINAPKNGQAFGTKARENLAAKVFRKTVRIEVIDVDRYRREVGWLIVRLIVGPIAHAILTQGEKGEQADSP
jgi:Staphylococcal nuclease homologue